MKEGEGIEIEKWKKGSQVKGRMHNGKKNRNEKRRKKW